MGAKNKNFAGYRKYFSELNVYCLKQYYINLFKNRKAKKFKEITEATFAKIVSESLFLKTYLNFIKIMEQPVKIIFCRQKLQKIQDNQFSIFLNEEISLTQICLLNCCSCLIKRNIFEILDKSLVTERIHL